MLLHNPEEATIVRELFRLYLERQGLVGVVTEATARGWYTKRWITKTGKPFGGTPFTKLSLRNLLTNLIYVGKVQVDVRRIALLPEWEQQQDNWQRLIG